MAALLEAPPFQVHGNYPREKLIRDLQDFYQAMIDMQAGIIAEMQAQIADLIERVEDLEGS